MTCSVQKVRDGVYRARVYVGVIDGKERTRSKTYPAANMREAKQAAAEYELAIRTGATEETSKHGTVQEIIDAWLTEQHGQVRSPTTMYRLKSIVARISAGLGAVPAHELTGRDVNAFYAALRKVEVAKGPPVRFMSESTVHHYHRVLRSILRYGARYDMIPAPATAKAITPKPIKHETVILPDEQMAELWRTAPQSIQLAISIEGLMGLRRGELFGLRWADIRGGVAHIANNTVVVPKLALIDQVPKGKRSRDVPIVPALQVALAQLRRDQEIEAERHGVKLARDARVMADLSADPTGRVPHNPTWLSDAWARHVKEADKRVRLHDLRHWCASQMLRDGVPIKTVQEILGHADPMTTLNLYGHAVFGSLDVARDALAGRGALLGLPSPDVPS